MTRKTFEVNTISHFTMVREFVPSMIKNNHGHVVTVASAASYIVHAQNVDYSCSKASALAFRMYHPLSMSSLARIDRVFICRRGPRFRAQIQIQCSECQNDVSFSQNV